MINRRKFLRDTSMLGAFEFTGKFLFAAFCFRKVSPLFLSEPLAATLDATSAAGRVLQVGDVLFEQDFGHAQSLHDWVFSGTGSCSITTDPISSHKVLKIESHSLSGTDLRHDLTPDGLRGNRIYLDVSLSDENVSASHQSGDGLKLVLRSVTPHGDVLSKRSSEKGPNGFRLVRASLDVPEDASSLTIELGVQDSMGTVVFESVKVSVGAVKRRRPARPVGAPTTESHERLRGVMYGPHGKADDIRVLASWGVNLIRWEMYYVTPEGRPDGWRDEVTYNAWIEGVLRNIDSLLPLCRELGIRVLIDLHTPPGGNILLPGWDWPLFQEKIFQDRFLRMWDQLARRYVGNDAIWGYDLANEPIQGIPAPGLMNWRELALAAAKRVRAIDPDLKHVIVFEPGNGGGWSELDYIEPLPVPGVVYSVHMYDPTVFTFQGIGASVGGTAADVAPVKYPGTIDGKIWNRDAIRRDLETVRRYQSDYGVPVFIGEFSVVRWAPGAVDFLSDCIDVFEEYSWDWTYHAFREWQAWSVELGPDRNNLTSPVVATDRAALLKSWFAKNANSSLAIHSSQIEAVCEIEGLRGLMM